MKTIKMYAGYRYPSQIISHAVWLYHRFTLSFRDVEELLKGQQTTPLKIVTDKLSSYSAAKRDNIKA